MALGAGLIFELFSTLKRLQDVTAQVVPLAKIMHVQDLDPDGALSPEEKGEVVMHRVKLAQKCSFSKGFDPLYRDRDANLPPSPRNPDLFADAEGALRAATLPLEVTQPSNAQARRAFLAERIKQLVWGSRKHHHQPNQFVAYPFRRRVNFDPLWNELIGFNLAGPIKMWLPCDRRRLDVIAGTIPILGDLRARELGVPLCGSFGFGELPEDWPKQDEGWETLPEEDRYVTANIEPRPENDGGGIPMEHESRPQLDTKWFHIVGSGVCPLWGVHLRIEGILDLLDSLRVPPS